MLRHLPLLVLVGCPTSDDDDVRADPSDETGTDEADSDTDTSTTEAVARPAPEVTLGEAVTCADPGARTVQPYERWAPPGAWQQQLWDPEAVDLFAGGGLTVIDLDEDGVLDVFLTHQQAAFRWYTLESDDSVDRTSELPPIPANTAAVTAVDIDGDGVLELHVTVFLGRDLLLKHTDEGWLDLAPSLGLAGRPTDHTVGASWADVDLDGDLDAFVAVHGDLGTGQGGVANLPPGDPSHLYLQGADGRFVDIVPTLPEEHPLRWSHAFQGAFLPLDDDLAPELYVVHDFGWRTPNTVHDIVNQAIVDRPGTGLEATGANMGLGVGDLNDDGVPDALVPAWDELALHLSVGSRGWYDAAQSLDLLPDPSRDQHVGWGAQLGDLDHDGDLDAYVAFGRLGEAALSPNNPPSQPDAVWVQEDGVFVDRGEAWGLDDRGAGRGVLLVDLDDDGWLDVIRQDVQGPATIDRARCGSEAWLRIVPRQPPGRNPYAVGAEVRVVHDGRTWRRWILASGTSFASMGPYEAHVGLGDLDRVDRVEIRWPDGVVDVVEDVPTRRRVTIRRADAEGS